MTDNEKFLRILRLFYRGLNLIVKGLKEEIEVIEQQQTSIPEKARGEWDSATPAQTSSAK